MGCDIHVVVERRSRGSRKWIGIRSSDGSISLASDTVVKKIMATRTPRGYDPDMWDLRHTACTGRNYAFFGALAGVRNDGPEPKGVPDDASELALEELTAWDGDAHSMSHDTLYHFIHTWLTIGYPDKLMAAHMNSQEAVDELVNAVAGDYVDLKDPDGPEYRVVYWFDN